MSTVVVGTVQSNSASPPTFKNTSGTEIGTLCRAFVNFNGTGTVAIRAAFNVSSITDNGTGDYTVNFTTAMPDANYSVFSTAQRGDSVAGGITGQVQGTTANAYTSITTTSVRIRTINVAETTIDPLYVGVSVFR